MLRHATPTAQRAWVWRSFANVKRLRDYWNRQPGGSRLGVGDLNTTLLHVAWVDTTNLCIVRAAAAAAVRRYYGKPWVWTVIHNSGGVRNMYGDLYQLSEGDYGPVRYLPTRQGHRGVAKPTGAGTRLAFNASDRHARGTSSGPGAGDAVAGEGLNVDSGAGPHTDGINGAAGAGAGGATRAGPRLDHVHGGGRGLNHTAAASTLAGIGYAPEAIEENPALYELLLEWS